MCNINKTFCFDKNYIYTCLQHESEDITTFDVNIYHIYLSCLETLVHMLYKSIDASQAQTKGKLLAL